MAVASLALAGCGGGDSTVQTQQPAAPVRQPPVQPVQPDCSLSPKPAGCPEPPAPRVVTRVVTRTVTPVAKFDGFSVTETVNLARVVKDSAGSSPLFGSGNSAEASIFHARQPLKKTTIPNIRPSVEAGKVIYAVDFHKVDTTTAGGVYSFFTNGIVVYPKAFSFNQNSYRATAFDVGLGEKFDVKILKAEVDSSGSNGANNAKLHVALASDYSSENTSDWMTWGYWMQAPTRATLNLSDYDMGTFAIHGTKYGALENALTGTVTYKGSMLGLHSSTKNGEAKLSSLTAKVTMDFIFGDASTLGSYNFLVNEFKLDNASINGQIASRPIPFWTVLNPFGVQLVVLANPTIDGDQYPGQMTFAYWGLHT